MTQEERDSSSPAVNNTDTSQQVMSAEYLRGFRDAIERAAKISEHHGNNCIGHVGDRAYIIAEAIRAIEPGEGEK